MDERAQILLIEDDPALRGVIQIILERKGHHLITVERGLVGLELLKSLTPDVLLLDPMLPDIDGWEIYHQMKADEQLMVVPVIIVSAKNVELDLVCGDHLVDNDRFLQKPFEGSDLINTVHDALARQATRVTFPFSLIKTPVLTISR